MRARSASSQGSGWNRGARTADQNLSHAYHGSGASRPAELTARDLPAVAPPRVWSMTVAILGQGLRDAPATIGPPVNGVVDFRTRQSCDTVQPEQQKLLGGPLQTVTPRTSNRHGHRSKSATLRKATSSACFRRRHQQFAGFERVPSILVRGVTVSCSGPAKLAFCVRAGTVSRGMPWCGNRRHH